MWKVDDVSRLGRRTDMDRRVCPSYEAGFDTCDPFAPVLNWRGDKRVAAKVLRRRCRSEGVERSPYENAGQELRESADILVRHNSRGLPNKSYFTLNSSNNKDPRFEQFIQETNLLVPENGDYHMAHELNRQFSYSPGRTKLTMNQTRPLLVSTLPSNREDHRLPKVEELLEKVDHEMLEVTVMKQPLKSILNNPLLKAPPQGILKKPKNKTSLDGKLHVEGRRRQRASSESDNYMSHYNSTGGISHDSRPVPNMKRAKDNSGACYSYGPGIASFTSPVNKHSTNHHQKNQLKCKCCEQHSNTSTNKDSNNHTHPTSASNKEKDNQVQVLRTTAITNLNGEQEVPLSRTSSPVPAVPPLPANSVHALVPPKKTVKVVKKKLKTKKPAKMKSNTKLECDAVEDDTEDLLSRSPSPDDIEVWKMETDSIMQEIKKVEKLSSAPPHCGKRSEDVEQKLEHNSVTQLSAKLTNGVVVSNKKDKSSKEQFLVALHTTNPFKLPILYNKECPSLLPESMSNCLRSSLFPRVPPYLKFIGHEDNPPMKVPMAIQKHLKWKLTTITPIVVKKTLANSGFRLVKSECDTSECPQEETVEWIGIWGKHMKSLMFRAIKDGQKMNHFPGTFQIGRKDRLWRNLQKLVTKHGKKEFGIMPKSYVLPHDLKLLKHDWDKYAAENERWIIKPPASARGTGIKVVSRWAQIPKKRPVVVQKYVSKPYLINGSKFDMRLYVLVTSVHPLRIYLHQDGLARFASVKYNDEISSLNDRYMHLTNYSINRLSKNYTPNEDFAACEGHKWTLQTLFQYLKTEKNVDTCALWESMKDLVIKTIISGEASISSLTKANITSRYNCYELFGIDVLLDENLKPWLLEVNISPSLHSASPLDIHVKGPLVTSVLNIAQFQIPVKINLESLSKEKPHKLAGLPYDNRLYTVYLSKEERDKHIIYTNMEERDMYLRDILSTLTPDDVRHLIQAEDELTQTGSMERIFPTHQTHKYLGFLAGPRYYNRLFDAWEARYHYNRESGLDLLKNLCDIGYHLEVPPVPLKNDVDAPTPAASARASVVSLELVASAAAAVSARALAPRTCGDGLAALA